MSATKPTRPWASSDATSRPQMKDSKMKHKRHLCNLCLNMPALSGTPSLPTTSMRAARWVKQDYRRSACVDTMRQQLHWPTLEKWRKQAHLNTFYKFHQGLIHIESRHCPSKSRRTTQHTHNLTYNSPSNRTAYDRKPSFLGPLTSVCSLLDL